LYIGNRPCFLIASFVFFGTTVWCGAATSFHSILAARIIAAFIGATTEAFAEAINADIFFLHQRGWWMGVYMVSQNAGSSLGGVISGFVVGGAGWRWHFWVVYLLQC
jgi:MFS family permease